MNSRLFVVGIVFAFSVGVLACEPPETDGEAGQAEGAVEVSEDGPDQIDDGGIAEYSGDQALIDEGEDLFSAKGCAGCHAMDRDGAGPGLGDVAQRRTAPWVARMIIAPGEMAEHDPEAQALREEYPAPMTDLGITAEEAEALVAYLGAQSD